MATTVTADLKSVFGESLSTNSFIRFILRNYGKNVPRITSSGVLAKVVQDAYPNGSGYVTKNVASNPDITPAGTYYSVEYYANGVKTSTADFNITGASLNLNSAVPITTTPVVTPPTGDTTYLRVDSANTNLTGTSPFTFGVINRKRYASNFSGADVGAQINAAFANLPASGGHVVAEWDEAKTITTPILIPDDNITLEFRNGATYTITPSGYYGIGTVKNSVQVIGNNARFLATKAWSDAGHYNIFDATSCDKYYIENVQAELEMTGAVPSVTMALVHCISVQNTITTADDATTDIAPTNATIRGNKVRVYGHVTDGTTLTKQAGIFFGAYGTTLRANGATIENNSFNDSYGRNVYTYHADNILIKGNFTPNLGATLTNANDSGAKHIRVIGCKNVTVDDNTAWCTGTNGFFRMYTIEGDAQSDNVQFTNNKGYFSGSYHASYTDGSCAMFIDWAKNSKISNNNFVYTGSGSTVIDGIQMRDVDGASTYIDINNNFVRDFPQRQLRIIDSTHTDVTVNNNTFIGSSIYTIPASLTRFKRYNNIEGTTSQAVSRDEPLHSYEGFLAGDAVSKTDNRLVRLGRTELNPSVVAMGLDVQTELKQTSGANSTGLYNANLIAKIPATNTQNHTSSDIGARVGVQSSAGATGTLSSPTGLRVTQTYDGTPVTTAYGVYIEAPTGGVTPTTKRSIHTEAGAGSAVINDGLTLGAGTLIKSIQATGTVAIDPGSINATSRGTATGSFTGAAVGDVVVALGVPSGLNDDLIFEGADVSATDTIRIYLYNPTAGPIDDTSSNWQFLLFDIT